MVRGRPPAKSDAKAVAARANVKVFMEERGYEARHIAPLAKISVPTAIRVLATNPPTWTEGFAKIVNYVNSQKNENSGLAELAINLKGHKGAARDAAALLRAVASLLERP